MSKKFANDEETGMVITKDPISANSLFQSSKLPVPVCGNYLAGLVDLESVR